MMAAFLLLGSALLAQDKDSPEWKLKKGDVLKVKFTQSIKSEVTGGAAAAGMGLMPGDLQEEYLGQAKVVDVSAEGQAQIELSWTKVTTKGKVGDQRVELEWADGKIVKAPGLPEETKTTVIEQLSVPLKIKLGKHGEFEREPAPGRGSVIPDFDFGPALPTGKATTWKQEYKRSVAVAPLPPITLTLKFEQGKDSIAISGSGEGEQQDQMTTLKTKAKVTTSATFADGMVTSCRIEVNVDAKGNPPDSRQVATLEAKVNQKLEISK